jgi:multisubunit Na+/H+ antiporter MnhC subunit
MIRKSLMSRDVQAVLHLTTPLILAAVMGDGLALFLLLAKLAGAAVPWALVLLPFVCGLAFMAGVIHHGWRLVQEQRVLDAAEVEEESEEDWDSSLEYPATEDHEATRD